MERVDLDGLRRRRWFAPVALSLGWLVLGAAAGVQEVVAGGPPMRWPRAAPPILAGVLWVPITFAATALARRFPWKRDRALTFVAVHVGAALATSFVLNAAFSSALALLGVPGVDIVAATLRTGIRWLHLNAGGYLAVVGAVHLLDRTATPSLRHASGGERFQMPLAEIDWIEADGDYARVHAAGRSYLLPARMKDLETDLADSSLVRVHRSAIVNVDRVREVRHRSHGDYEAVLADGTVVRVSRTRREGLLDRLS
ncbi:MAG: LytTR family DNA-binding domain-containing protein [Gemmatimonadota bacterium]|jgi:two-component system LytT family response regulator